MKTIVPGSELDALVAIKVMGWTILSHWEPGVVKHLVDENQCEVSPPEFPPYSTDIAAAWRVVKMMRESSFSTRDRFETQLQVVVSRRLKTENCLIHQQAIICFLVPSDICVAALEAVTVR